MSWHRFWAILGETKVKHEQPSALMISDALLNLINRNGCTNASSFVTSEFPSRLKIPITLWYIMEGRGIAVDFDRVWDSFHRTKVYRYMNEGLPEHVPKWQRTSCIFSMRSRLLTRSREARLRLFSFSEDFKLKTGRAIVQFHAHAWDIDRIVVVHR